MEPASVIERIHNNHPYLKNIKYEDESLENKIHLIYGKIQSGKTSSIIALCHLAALNNLGSIVIIPNQKEGYLQLRDRIDEYNKKDDIKSGNVLEPVFVGERGRKSIQKIGDIISGEETFSSLICLGNSSEMKKLNDIIHDTEQPKPYILIVDEADITYKNDLTKYRTEFVKLADNARKIINITATTFKFWFCETKLYTPNISILPENSNYKGLDSFTYKYIPEEIECSPPTREDRPLEKDGYIVDYLLEKGQVPHYKVGQEYHPHIVLYRSSEILNEHHLEILEDLMEIKEITDIWTIIVYNGDGIYLYNKGMTEKVKISGEKSYYKYGVHHFSSVALKDLLEWMRHEYGKYDFSHILIVSGKYANRMISFVSSSYRWHLTSMYLLVNKTSCDNLLQMCRLCGVYPNDNIPLEFVSHKDTIDDIKKAYLLQEKVINNPQDIKNKILQSITSELSKETLVNKVQTMVISSKSLPARNLVKGVRHNLTVERDVKTSILSDGKSCYCINKNDIGSGIGGKILERLFEILEAKDKRGKWIERPVIVKEILKLGDSFSKSINQINGHLSKIAEKSLLVDGDDVSGLLVKKTVGDRWFFKIN